MDWKCLLLSSNDDEQRRGMYEEHIESCHLVRLNRPSGFLWTFLPSILIFSVEWWMARKCIRTWKCTFSLPLSFLPLSFSVSLAQSLLRYFTYFLHNSSYTLQITFPDTNVNTLRNILVPGKYRRVNRRNWGCDWGWRRRKWQLWTCYWRPFLVSSPPQLIVTVSIHTWFHRLSFQSPSTSAHSFISSFPCHHWNWWLDQSIWEVNTKGRKESEGCVSRFISCHKEKRKSLTRKWTRGVE